MFVRTLVKYSSMYLLKHRPDIIRSHLVMCCKSYCLFRAIHLLRDFHLQLKKSRF